MSDGFYLDILFFAMVAAFIAFRLRSVLGRKTGQERRRPSTLAPRPAKVGGDNVVPIPERVGAPPPVPEDRAIAELADGDVKDELTQIRGADASFDLNGFLQGARAAFAMIVEAYAKGDKDALRPLLSDAVYGQFAGAIDQRVQAGETLTTELVATRSADVAGAAMNGPFARVTVRFASEQINVTRDRDGQVVDGDPKRIEEVVDLWTFERDTRSRDPNWELVETRAPS
ncbi:MAG: Tim44/TimA family putative adaptor protein [Geminicoccaceae bacterium]